MKIADLVLLSLFMRANEKCNPSTGLSGTEFSILNELKSLIPKDQKKYNNTELEEKNMGRRRVTCNTLITSP